MEIATLEGETIMGYVKCPKCGSTKCQLTSRGRHHGIFYFIIFGLWWLIYAIYKWTIGLCVLFLFDWWYAIIKACKHEAYYWHCKKWFVSRNSYYCQDCGYNFKA